MMLFEFKGYEIHQPTSGGRAGKGYNKTSTIQVRKIGYIEKQIRFEVVNPESRSKAIEKAKEYIFSEINS